MNETNEFATSTRFNLHGIDLTDEFWDLASIHAYHRYVSDNIFAPAGVTLCTASIIVTTTPWGTPSPSPGRAGARTIFIR